MNNPLHDKHAKKNTDFYDSTFLKAIETIVSIIACIYTNGLSFVRIAIDKRMIMFSDEGNCQFQKRNSFNRLINALISKKKLHWQVCTRVAGMTLTS